jgi:hypothetical protein
VSIRAVDPARSRIVLVGAPFYDDPQLPDVPQVSRNLADLSAVLTDPAVGGFPAGHCVLADPDMSVEHVGDLLEQAASQAEDLLLFYFAGHGLVGPRGELYLGLRRTRFGNPAFSAVRFETVRDAFLELGARAANRVVILDSCFSGRAIGLTLGSVADTLADELEINGTYTLTSAPPNSVAMVRAGEVHTAFTGRLISLLSGGDERLGDLMSLGDIYRRLHARLLADGLPLPQQRGTATADLLGLVRNVRPAPPQPAPLTEEIRTLLDSSSPHGRLAAVAELAEWLTGADPGRALAARAALEQVAERDNPRVAGAACRVLGAAATTSSASAHAVRSQETVGTGDPSPRRDGRTDSADKAKARRPASALQTRAESMLNDAECIANTITDYGSKAQALGRLARAVATSDPDRAVALVNQAERAANAITDNDAKAGALAEIVQVIAANDPNRAERIANTITDNGSKVWVLAEIAEVVVVSDPASAAALVNRGERIAEAITDDEARAQVLGTLARVVAASDPDRAERTANAITDNDAKAQVLAEIALVVAASHPDRAERIANAITDNYLMAQTLAGMAPVVAANDPDRAEHIADIFTRNHEKARVLAEIAKAVAANDPNRAATLANQAERVANAITDNEAKAQVLAEIAKAVAANDPNASPMASPATTQRHGR